MQKTTKDYKKIVKTTEDERLRGIIQKMMNTTKYK